MIDINYELYKVYHVASTLGTQKHPNSSYVPDKSTVSPVYQTQLGKLDQTLFIRKLQKKFN